MWVNLRGEGVGLAAGLVLAFAQDRVIREDRHARQFEGGVLLLVRHGGLLLPGRAGL